MRALKLILIGIAFFLAKPMQAQVEVNVNVGSPPQWGPVGYTEVRYYYLPDVEAYYDVQSSMFIYYTGGVWIHKTYLPRRYRSYDLYGGYKVVMTDYHGDAPYVHFREYKTKYVKGYRGPSQKTIGQKPGRGNSKEGNYSNKRTSRDHSKSRNVSEPRNKNAGSPKNKPQGNDNKMKRSKGGKK